MSSGTKKTSARNAKGKPSSFQWRFTNLSISNLPSTTGTSKSNHGAILPSSGESLPTAQPGTVNVIIFGESGVGKSSVVNLIAQEMVAKVSSDITGCTMESTPYNVSFDDLDFTIFDTVGLEEPKIGINGYLRAIEKAFELIKNLEAAGGIHLLLFCMRAGRLTATTQSNYRMFYEFLCDKKVPIALIFTGLEREKNMEDWWEQHGAQIVLYGINSCSHACITAVHDDTEEEIAKYEESKKKIRHLIKDYALPSAAPLPELHSWFARFAERSMSFIKKHFRPKKKILTKTLTKRCGLAPDVAKKIVNMMEKGCPESNENETEKAESKGNPGVLSRGVSVAVADKQGRRKNSSHDVTKDAVSRSTSSADPEYKHGAGHTNGPPPPTRSSTINVIVIGEPGVGKSSVVNLIAGNQLARVSHGLDICTTKSTPYKISLDGMNLTIYDTVGLGQSIMEGNRATEEAFELIKKLKVAGGIHLLLFCIHRNNITSTAQKNYRMFYEVLCVKKVPIALVFTDLEREKNMEDCWERNKARLESFGIKSHGHACITAVHNGTEERISKYMDSQMKIRRLIKTLVLESAAHRTGEGRRLA